MAFAEMFAQVADLHDLFAEFDARRDRVLAASTLTPEVHEELQAMAAVCDAIGGTFHRLGAWLRTHQVEVLH